MTRDLCFTLMYAYCWFLVSRQSKYMKSRIWGKKESINMQKLSKIQVTASSLNQDVPRKVLLKFMKTCTWRRHAGGYPDGH